MSFCIENLPLSAARNIISKMIQNIENDTDIQCIIRFLGLSKFLNKFDKENVIKEIYDTLKIKNLIKKDIIDSNIDLKKKIQYYIHDCIYNDNHYDPYWPEQSIDNPYYDNWYQEDYKNELFY